MPDLDALHTAYKAARLRYLNIRRDAEEALVAEMVARIKALEAREPDIEHFAKVDRMAVARAAKAAKIEVAMAEKMLAPGAA